MISEERLHLMIQLADYKQENQDKSLSIVKYQKKDYMAFALVKNLVITTILFGIFCGVYAVLHIEFVLANLEGDRFTALLGVTLILYFMILGIYSVVVYMITRIRYLRAEDEVKGYRKHMARLMQMYKDEEKLNQDLFGGSDI